MPLSTRSRSESGRLLSLLLLSVSLLFAIYPCAANKTASTATATGANLEQPKPLPSGSAVRHDTVALDQKRGEAQAAMDRAAMLSATWTEESLREAIDLYEKAALNLISLSDSAGAAQAILKSGDLYFLLNEYAQALKRYQKVEALAGKTGDWLLKANSLSRMGRLRSFVGNNELAQKQLIQALDLFARHESDRSEIASNAYGEALSNLAEVSYAKGDFVTATAKLKRALEVLHNDPQAEAKVHLFNGYITGSVGDPENAVLEIYRALDLYREANDKIGEGLALTTLALSHSLKREMNRAIELHEQAIDIFRTAGDRHSEAIALNGLGQVYEGISDYPVAISQYERALRLFEEIGSVDGMSVANFKLARTYNLNRQPDEALAFYERCLQLSRAAGKVRTEVIALNEIARVYAANGRHEQALRQHQKIQKFYETIGDLRGQATALNAYGDFLLQLGQKEKAIDAYRRALPLSEKSGNKGILLSTLFSFGRANLAVGSPDDALSSMRRSLEIIEDLRANLASPDFRVSYLSGLGKHYELCVEILMQLDRLHPGQGFDAEALMVNEKGRARLLVDLVSESQANFREGAEQTLLARERELRGFFRVQAQYRMDLFLSRKDSAEIGAVDDQLTQFKVEYQQIQAQLRQQNSHLLSLEVSTPLNLQQIQNELRDGDTMLLEYALGDERSYVWAVTSNSLKCHELPARKVIEDAAREFYAVVTARQASDRQANDKYEANVEAADNGYFEKATKLSQMLLSPFAEQLGSKRLLVVTAGALQHIPLDALPLPVAQSARPEIPAGTSGTLLIESNEVVVLPSFSTLIAIRSARHRTMSPGKLVAVIADPVFNGNDDRVKSQAGSGGIAQASSDTKSDHSVEQIAKNRSTEGGLARLAHASEEADAISAVAPWGTTLVAKGFDASRETAMSPNLGQYQILHFATHGFIDSQHPELSGMVLSTVDREGKATSGMMPLHDIYSLRLASELTVLSACQTALGKDIRGEGLIGLTHSFMSAGSNTVVASLWKVDDRATALLMADFYESMFQKGMPPASALRAAKLKLMQDKRWSAPYYWAGFVLQGEYTNHIAVGGRHWLRLGFVFLILVFLVAAAVLIFRKRNPRLFAHSAD